MGGSNIDAVGRGHVAVVTFVPTADDVGSCIRWSLIYSRGGRRHVRYATLRFVIFILFAAGLVALWKIAAGVSVILLFGIAVAVHGRGSPKRMIIEGMIRRLTKRAVHGAPLVMIKVIADAHGLRKEQSDGRAIELPWRLVGLIQRSEAGIFIVSNDEPIVFVPARAFSSPADLGRFQELCSSLWKNDSSALPSENAVEVQPPGADAPSPLTNSKSSAIAASQPLNELDYAALVRPCGMASVSLALAVASLVTLPFLLPALILGIVAVVTGLLARRRIRRSMSKVLGLANANWGVGLGAFSVLVSTCLMVLSISVISLVWGSIRNVVTSAVPIVRSGNMASALFNAAGIAQACRIYAVGHGGRLPQHMAILLITGACTPQQLCDPNSSTAPIPISKIPKAEADWRIIEHDVDSSSDFLYVGQGLVVGQSGDPAEADLIVVYGRDIYGGEGRVVGFVDGNARFVESRDLRVVFEKCNAARKQLGLKAIVMDVPSTP
jgi:hypothetical protein